jgi:hypothetical protein
MPNEESDLKEAADSIKKANEFIKGNRPFANSLPDGIKNPVVKLYQIARISKQSLGKTPSRNRKIIWGWPFPLLPERISF